MASTIKVQDVANWVQPYLKGIQTNVGGTYLQPLLTNANTILQTIVGPPFCWRWNRSTATFNTVVGTQDTALSISDFGFIEKASSTVNSSSFEIVNIRNILGIGTEPGRPHSIAAQTDNNAGTITFRLLPVPDKIYTISVVYQKKPTLITSLSGLWTPIPDEYSYIYNRGMLAMMLLYAGDAQQAMMESQRFMAHLLGASEGLDELQKNAFMESWLLSSGQAQARQLKTQTGNQARTV